MRPRWCPGMTKTCNEQRHAHAEADKCLASGFMETLIVVGWILRSLRAGVPLLGEPSFRVGVSHRAVAG